MTAIDMHNHLIAPGVADFLAREGEKYATRLVEQNGQKFFVIQESSRRPYNDKISCPEARLVDMEAGGIGIQAVSCVPFLMYPEVAPDLGLAIAQVNNDALAVIGQRLSDRFMPLASVLASCHWRLFRCKTLQWPRENWNGRRNSDCVG